MSRADDWEEYLLDAEEIIKNSINGGGKVSTVKLKENLAKALSDCTCRICDRMVKDMNCLKDEPRINHREHTIDGKKIYKTPFNIFLFLYLNGPADAYAL